MKKVLNHRLRPSIKYILNFVYKLVINKIYVSICHTMKRHPDSWPPEEKNSIWGQRRGLIAQSFCVIKFYYSIKEIEKASDIDIRRGQKEYPLASVSNGVIHSPMNSKNVWRL